MQTPNRCCSSATWWLSVGAVLAGLAVVTGAFAAHGLDRYCAEKYRDAEPSVVAGFEVPTSWKRLQDFKTGAEYQMYHALGLIAVGLLLLRQEGKALQFAGWAFLLGIVFFSGSLYVLTITGQTAWGAIAPIGGTLFIAGWGAVAVSALSYRSPTEPAPRTSENE
jgi:uncharacterized membrane protein YgdD (TMEM256/DUF423 family)